MDGMDKVEIHITIILFSSSCKLPQPLVSCTVTGHPRWNPGTNRAEASFKDKLLSGQAEASFKDVAKLYSRR